MHFTRPISLFTIIVLLLNSILGSAQNTLYKQSFDAGTASGNTYSSLPNTISNYLVNSKWSVSPGSWTYYSGNGINALATNNAGSSIKTLDLSFHALSQIAVNITGFSFYHRSSSTGYSIWTLKINGQTVGSGNIFVDALNGSNPMQSTGNITLSTPVTGLFGDVHVTLELSGGAHGGNATFRFDDFTLIGTTQFEPGSSGGNDGNNDNDPSTQAVMAINGTFDVSDMGMASYNLPIGVPSGLGGLQPSVSLNYSSQAGNGIAGMGWSLAGASAITRVGQTIYHDNAASGMSLTATDNFSLDGQRLIFTDDGSGVNYYATETESYKSVESHGTLGNGPEFFKVTDPNGWIYIYGANANERLETGGTAIAWFLSTVTDLNGNRMRYEYDNASTGEVVLKNIYYNYNSSQVNSSARTLISFYYDSRNDVNFSYLAGKKIQTDKLLTEIRVKELEDGFDFDDVEPVRSYKLEYQVDQYTHLVKIRELGNNGIKEVSPTTIAYNSSSSPQVTVQSLLNQDAGLTWVPESDGSVFGAYSGLTYTPGDYNGDGLTDFMVLPYQYNPNFNVWKLAKNIGNAYTFVAQGNLPDMSGYAGYQKDNLRNRPIYLNYNPTLFDYNGDGKNDFIYRTNYPLEDPNNHPEGTLDVNNYTLFMSDDTGLQQTQRKITAGTAASPGALVIPHPPIQATDGFNNTYPLAGDYDGDGKTEILVLKESQKYSISAPSGFAGSFLIGENYLTESGSDYLLAQPLFHMPFDATYLNEPNINNRSKFFVIDYDGDGKNEILSVWQNHAQVFKLNVTFDSNHKPTVGDPAFVMVNESGYPTVWHDILTGDFNGDGITDVLTWIDPVGWEVGYGKGDGLMNDIHAAPAALVNKPSNASHFIGRPVVIMDYNGDGKDDIFDYTSNISNTYGAGHAPRIHYSVGNNVFQTEYPNISASQLAPSIGNYFPCDGDGDGVMDLLTKVTAGSDPVTISFHPNENRHLVSAITNGMGVFTNINYTTLTNSNVYQTGSQTSSYPIVRRTLPVKVVSSITEDNGVNAAGNTTNFKYEGLKLAYWGRGYLGFDKITSTNTTTLTSAEKTTSLNTSYLLSFPAAATTRINGNIVSSQTSSYAIHDFGNRRIFPYLSASTSSDNLTKTNTQVLYDYGEGQSVNGFGIGKPLTVTTLKGFEASLSGTGQIEKTVQTYTYPTASGLPYQRNFQPDKITTASTRSGDGVYTRATSYTYDNNKGWLLSTIQDPSTLNTVTTTNTYNAYGNLLTKTVSASGLPSSMEQYEYDTYQRYLTKVFNIAHPDVATLYEYEDRTGNLLKKTDPDGLVTNYSYDVFDRVKHTDNTNGQVTGMSYLWNTSAPAVKYVAISSSNTAAPQMTYYDRLARKLGKAYMSLNGSTISTETSYDIKGQVTQTTQPHFSNEVAQNTGYAYDIYGRQTAVNAPEGSTTFTYNATSDNVLDGQNQSKYSVTITPPAGSAKTTVTDASGRTIRNEDAVSALTYDYSSTGAVKMVKLNGQPVQQNTFDAFGRQTTQSDPNYGATGAYTYTYTAYGQMLTRNDPHGHTYSYTYDALGNVATKTGPEGQYVYTYNYTAGPNCGKQTQISAPGSVTQLYDYGMGNKLNSMQLNANGQSLTTAYAYDTKGRVKNLTFPNGKQVEYGYNINDGSLQIISSPVNIPLPDYYVCRTRNALGQTTYETLGGDPGGTYTVSTNYSYDSYNRLSEQNSISPIASNQLKHFQYQFDPGSGNLQWRKDVEYGLQENFTYDNLNRLTGRTSNVTTAPALTLSYTSDGNIKKKSDAGVFSYSNQTNRLIRIDSFLNIPSTEQDVTYTPFDMVDSITEDQNQAAFTYWADGSRSSMKLLQNGLLQKTKYYAPDFEREVDAVTGAVRDLCYINGPDGNIVVVMATENGTDRMYYVVTDHLGSIVQIVDESGNPVMEKSFDAWGRLRNPQTWADLPSTYASDGWDRGYTGHEHLPSFGIINMNGRLYDPVMGRMFSPDPYIMGKGNTQGYNRYTYALNNPLIHTDPSGKILPVIVGAMIYGAIIGAASSAAVYAITAGHEFTWAGLGKSALFGGVAGAIGGGLTSAASSVIGPAFANSLAFGIVRSSASQIAANVIVGNKITAATIVGSVAGGLVQGSITPYSGVSGNAFSNITSELAYSGTTAGLAGLVSGGVAAGLSGGNILDGAFKGIESGVKGGLSLSAFNIATFGWSTVPGGATQSRLRTLRRNYEYDVNQDPGYVPPPQESAGRFDAVYRTGGLYSLLTKNGVTWGRNLVVPDGSNRINSHEYVHFLQQLYEGFGSFQLQGIYEQGRSWTSGIFGKGWNPYQTPGTNEFNASGWGENYFGD